MSESDPGDVLGRILDDVDRRLYRIEGDINEIRSTVSALDTDQLLAELREIKVLLLAQFEEHTAVRVQLKPRKEGR